jgi:2-polyprenyl-3-methyl-5-hydroxy-6-metoxy-1,4-benzoquinol methylase
VSDAPCRACGGAAVERWRVAHEVAAGRTDEGRWELLRCRDCGTAMLPGSDRYPPPPELYEVGTYAPSAGLRDVPLRPLRRLADGERLRLLGALPPAARVIDVGAGRGRMVAALRARGFDAVGIEPSVTGAQAARARDLPVEPVALESAAFPPGEADLVVLWHVLEHLDDPQAALERARPWIKGNGRLVVSAPNLASLQARIGGDRWFHQDVPRHRTHFTAAGLQALLRRSGFGVSRPRHLIMEQNWLGMWLTLLNRLTFDRDVPFRFAKRDLSYRNRREAAWDGLISVVAGIPLIPVAVSVELVAELARQGGTVVVHASPR